MNLGRLALCAQKINERHSNFSLLDAGCRTMDLEPLLKGCDSYSGTDLTPGEGVLVCDLEKPLLFDDDSFDVVVCLDVLEHLDNPHEALAELLRVARKTVYVSLPNMFYIEFRWRFFTGGGISGKYTFPVQPIVDRHRWILSYTEASEFIVGNCKGFKVVEDMILPVRGRTKWFMEPLERFLGRTWPNLFAYGALFEIRIN